MLRNKYRQILAIAFWLIIWQLGATIANRNLLLPIPTAAHTAKALVQLLAGIELWETAVFSLARVALGYISALILGSIFAFASKHYQLFQTLSSPILKLIRAIPVASFILLLFLWIPRALIPTCISFCTVLPIVWGNISEGLRKLNPELDEMVQVFGMSSGAKLRYLILPQLKPYITASMGTGLGFAWKSGVAAEIICRTPVSLGNMLWAAKTAIAYDELFAITLVIVLLSVFLEMVSKIITKEGSR